MDIQCAPASFEIRLSEKRDTENETEFMLPEYLPNIQNLIKTDVRIKITDKTVGESGVTVSGTLIYAVLYRSDHNGALKCAVFSDDFTVGFDFPDNAAHSGTEGTYHVLCFPYVGNVNAKMQSQRRVSVKCRFSLYCEVLATEIADDNSDGKTDSENQTHCDLQLQSKTVNSGNIHFSDEYRHIFSEELLLEDGMPEISEVLYADADICIKEIQTDDMKTDIDGEIRFSCLYEAQTENQTEYICFTKEIPFRAEPDFDFPCEGQKIMAKADLASLTVESVSDAYGEQKKLAVSGEILLCLMGFCNKTVSVITDLYSTDCEMIPQKKTVRNLSFADTYDASLYSEESLRAELRGITDLISSSVSVCFGNPEFSDGKVFLPANGSVSLLGMKENGDVESIRIPLHSKIPSHDIPYSLSGEKIKWFNTTALCSHECEISGGELILKLWVRESLCAFYDETLEIICGCEENTEHPGSIKHSGFTLYFPDEGESVWDVSKSHAVSVEKVRAENNVSGDIFDGKKTILLHG